MTMQICGAPCCWGVDDITNPFIPPWQRVLKEAHEAGYRAIELGPYNYLPIRDISLVVDELNKNGLAIVAGTIFLDIVSPEKHQDILKAVDEICELITNPAMPKLETFEGQHYPTPYLTVMDWGHDERDFMAGNPEKSPRMSKYEWRSFMGQLKAICERSNKWGVRPVIHPHAGGYIEFEDEIDAVLNEIPYETAGLVLDTGHAYYSRMDPAKKLRDYQERLDYVHFKDVNNDVYRKVVEDDHIRFFEGCGMGSMCPIGSGDLDYAEILKTLNDINYNGYITIEQERDPRNVEGSLKDVKQSVDYLKSVGFKI